MENDNQYTLAFDLIYKAGNARSSSILAIEAAREYDFETAEKHLNRAEEELYEAHEAQMSMIKDEANGKRVDVNVILVHAQDHLTMAMLQINNAKEFLHIYKLLKKLSKEEG